ncbi:MAG TPA: hypothetical protein VKN35_07790 [Xanthomonadales bacterium]|nr:hypothetical protein [Xanthomonadales bacterium]
MSQSSSPGTPEPLSEIALQQAREHPNYFDDPHKDELIRLALTLAEEVCVLRDRLETASILGGLGSPCSAAAIDAFKPDESLMEQRLARHSAYFEKLMERLLPPDLGD